MIWIYVCLFDNSHIITRSKIAIIILQPCSCLGFHLYLMSIPSLDSEKASLHFFLTSCLRNTTPVRCWLPVCYPVPRFQPPEWLLHQILFLFPVVKTTTSVAHWSSRKSCVVLQEAVNLFYSPRQSLWSIFCVINLCDNRLLPDGRPKIIS